MNIMTAHLSLLPSSVADNVAGLNVALSEFAPRNEACQVALFNAGIVEVHVLVLEIVQPSFPSSGAR